MILKKRPYKQSTISSTILLATLGLLVVVLFPVKADQSQAGTGGIRAQPVRGGSRVNEEGSSSTNYLDLELQDITSGQIIRLEKDDRVPRQVGAGRLGLLVEGVWRNVCPTHWSEQSADIACKLLGFDKGAEDGRSLVLPGKVSEDGSTTSQSTGSLVTVRCQGNVTSFNDCVITSGACESPTPVILKCRENEGCDAAEGWAAGRDGLCYKLMRERVTFQTADKTCQSIGAHLVRIDNQAENDFLSDLLHVAFDGYVGRIWMAAHKSSRSGRQGSRTGRRGQGEQSEPRWKWYGTSLDLRFTKWFPGFPPNGVRGQPLNTDDRDCVSLSNYFFDSTWDAKQVGYYFWQNWPCANSLPYVCRKAATLFGHNECYHGNGADYRGKVEITIRGSVCQPWTASNKVNSNTHPHTGLGDHNYCRNPDNDKRPWCWVDTNQNLFGYCTIPPCDLNCTWEKEMSCDAGVWSRKCLPLSRVCDENVDCDDGSDERQCTREDMSIRLVGGDAVGEGERRMEGRVEITINNMTGSICDDKWNDDSASVICRMLGFRDGIAVEFGEYGRGRGPIWLDDVRCEGHEGHILDCDHAPLGTNNCGHHEDAAVRCLPFTEDTERPDRTHNGGECGKRFVSPSRARIIGGTYARYGSVPWQARIMKRDLDTGEWMHACGGTIIAERWILSAAHCFEMIEKSEIRVRVGDHRNSVIDSEEQHFEVERIIPHPLYTSSALFFDVRHDFDIALARLRPSIFRPGIEFNQYVQPACLPVQGEPTRESRTRTRGGRRAGRTKMFHMSMFESLFDRPRPHRRGGYSGQMTGVYQPGLECEISGWGYSYRQFLPPSLKSGTVPLLSQHRCDEVYWEALSSNMFCAGHRNGSVDTCQGDSGGPLVCNIDGSYTVMGVTSWGQGCGKKNSPGVYTKVDQMTDWIIRMIRRYD